MTNENQKEIVFHNQWITVENQQWENLDHPYTVVRPRLGKAVVIIPVRFVKGEAEVLMVQQPRIPAGNMVWEFPAGGVDESEDAFTSALRELEEETNIQVMGSELINLGSHYLAPASIDETVYIYAVVLKKHYPFDSIKPAAGEIFGIQWLTKTKALEKCASDPSYDFSSLGKIVLAEQFGVFEK